MAKAAEELGLALANRYNSKPAILGKPYAAVVEADGRYLDFSDFNLAKDDKLEESCADVDDTAIREGLRKLAVAKKEAGMPNEPKVYASPEEKEAANPKPKTSLGLLAYGYSFSGRPRFRIIDTTEIAPPLTVKDIRAIKDSLKEAKDAGTKQNSKSKPGKGSKGKARRDD